MRLKLNDTTIYAKDFTIETSASEEMEISIGEGYAYIDTSLISEECAKSEREKVWELAEHILRIPYTERLKYFGTNQAFDILSMPVDRALDMYEAWKKNNSMEELIKSLKPQDVVAYNSGIDFDYRILMITRVIALDGKWYTFDGITRNGRSTVLYISIDDSKFTVKKIGRVVETTDILGEIKKIEDEWRKNR